MQVLQRLDLFTDTGLKEQLAQRLEPIVCCAPTSPRPSSARSRNGNATSTEPERVPARVVAGTEVRGRLDLMNRCRARAICRFDATAELARYGYTYSFYFGMTAEGRDRR